MKLPQWSIVILSFLLVVGTWVLAENAKGDFTLPATVLAAVGTVLQIVKMILGLTTNSVATNRSISRASARIASTLLVAACLALLLFVSPGCSSAQTQAAIPAVSVDAECILSHVVGCALASPPTPWATCAEQTALACGTDTATVVSVWSSHRAAEAREGDAGVSYP